MIENKIIPNKLIAKRKSAKFKKLFSRAWSNLYFINFNINYYTSLDILMKLDS